jgi:hypothetical protein
MESVTLRNVQDLPSAEKRSLETLLEHPLEEGQQVFIATYRPGAVPDELTRRAAHEVLIKELHEFQRGAVDQATPLEEVDAAVDEAMSIVRPYSS